MPPRNRGKLYRQQISATITTNNTLWLPDNDSDGNSAPQLQYIIRKLSPGLRISQELIIVVLYIQYRYVNVVIYQHK